MSAFARIAHVGDAAFGGLIENAVGGTKIGQSLIAHSTQTINALASTATEFLLQHQWILKRLSALSTDCLAWLGPTIDWFQTRSSMAQTGEDLNADHRTEEETNIASISPEQFEHLIGELFRKEFAGESEVRVTRASQDGGVDAVVFDPDSIRGGKILIQAKRYANTVGVAAIRELYGMVVNEGGSKGILVTTSTFSNDAYAFAKEKPIALLDRNDLLSMLKKHGINGHIDFSSGTRRRS